MEEEEKEKTSTAQNIFAFFATLIMIPLLFVGTCVPIGSGLGSASVDGHVTIFIVMGYSVLFVGGLVWRAFTTKSQGTMWAIILILGIIIYFVASFAFMEFK